MTTPVHSANQPEAYDAQANFAAEVTILSAALRQADAQRRGAMAGSGRAAGAGVATRSPGAVRAVLGGRELWTCCRKV